MGVGTADIGAAEISSKGAEAQVHENRASNPTDSRSLSDDEILGLGDHTRTNKRRSPDGPTFDDDDAPASATDTSEDGGKEFRDHDKQSDEGHEDSSEKAGVERFREIFDANPELKQAWEAAQAYRELFATPEDAQSATRMLEDLKTMDTLFFSSRPNDHVELARIVATLDPAAFESLAKAMSVVAMSGRSPGKGHRTQEEQVRDSSEDGAKGVTKAASADTTGKPGAQEQFLHAANADAVKGVLQAIEAQVDRILPESVSKGARNRVVGEIYRELDASLQSNTQFSKQVRSAIRSGSFDSSHHGAVVSLILGRAKQALPSVAKRVLNEWTSTVLATDRDRREKRGAAESRVDISGTRGSGGEGARVRSPRDIDYGRMSDADILNL